MLQHQAPTSPGISGSPVTSCGAVVGVNNAGTIEEVVKPDGQGGFVVDRVTAAANNFAVGAQYVSEMVSLFRDSTIQGFELPPPFVPVTAPFAGAYQGAAGAPRTHAFVFTLSREGALSGTSDWGTLRFHLAGAVDTRGSLAFQDDATTQGYATGFYAGTVDGAGNAGGTYAEGTADNVLASWSAARQ